MNILYFSQIFLRQGGGEKNLLQLGEHLKNKNNIFLAAPMNEQFQLKAKKVFKEIFLLPRLRRISFKNIFVAQKLKKIIQEHQIEIVHTINPRARLLAILLKNKLDFKLVHTIHSSPFLYQDNFLKNFVFKRIEKFLNKRTDQVIFVSQDTQNVFLKENLLPKKNYQVIYNGIDLDLSYQILKNKEEFKEKIWQKYDFSEKTILISFVGRFSFEKNLFTLIQVAPEIVKEFPNSKFILVGDGEEKKNLVKAIKKNNLENYFILTGYLEKEKAAQIVSASDLFVLPSFYETFSYTVLEALSLKTPVVATKVGGVQELIQNDFNGVLVLRDSQEELIKGIKKILTDSNFRKKIINNGWQKAQRFSEKNMVENTKKVYQTLINSFK